MDRCVSNSPHVHRAADYLYPGKILIVIFMDVVCR